MALTLQVTSYKNHLPNNELLVTVNESGCTIGRASDNDLVLSDVERIISHRHATIQFEDGVYYLTDNSTNGAYINHAPEPIGQGNRVLLHDGDVLSIGGYDCAISIETQQKQSSSPLLEKAAWLPPIHPEAHEKKQNLIKDPYPVPSISSPLPSDTGSRPAVEQDYFKPPEAIRDDWDELTGMNLEIQPEVPPVIPEPEKKPEITPSQPISPELKVPRDSQQTTDLNQQAIDAFLAGTGLKQVKLEPEEMISFMTTSGQLLREMTQGFRQVMDSRTSLKGEFRLGMTTIQPTENNPLKFSVDVDDALSKLLFPPSKGYLPPILAIQDATDDLQAHQMAFLAGLRAALNSLVSLFDPEMFEKDLQNVSAVDNLLPSIKKAKYWEAFKTQYKKTAADAENDFLHFLGNEFASAYEQQIRILKNNRHNK